VSEVCQRFEPVPQLLKSIRYNGINPLDNDMVKSAVEAGRLRLGNAGRLLIRPSGTEPVIRVMAEADDKALVTLVVDEIAASIEQCVSRGGNAPSARAASYHPAK
jgi:phosphoglucosamine mutase